MDKKGLHDGHRQRLRDKFEKYNDVLTDHEILELLLGYSIKRKDTNELSHKLIDKFGSLNEVFNKSPDVLQGIDGIGETTACFLSLIGTAQKRCNSDSNKSKSGIITIEKAKAELIKMFEDATTEVFYALFLNKQNKVFNVCAVEGDKNHVSINAFDFTKSVLLNKPYSIIIAHNHFAKFPYPSNDDDETTAKIYSILQLYGVNFFDHIIVSGNEIYSYFYDNRLQKIKDKINKQHF